MIHTLTSSGALPVGIKALAFDVFGTVVDWRSSVSREIAELALRRGINVDADACADAWRAGYRTAILQVNAGELPWMSLDRLHRMLLDRLCEKFGLTGCDETDKEHLNRAWHRLTPWPDTVVGLERLKRRFLVTALSNGNIALLCNLAKHVGLPWDMILSADMMRRFKPDPAVYLGAVDALGLTPDEVMMVATHRDDLHAAARQGLRTAFVHRPLEYGPVPVSTEPLPGEFDLVVRDVIDLAVRCGI